MRRVYICHPFNGKQENIDSIAKICRILAEGRKDIIPISPVHSFSYLDDSIHRNIALKYCLELLSMCDEVWVYGGWQESTGCKSEIAHASKLGIKVVEKTPPCPTIGCGNDLSDAGCAWYCDKCGYRAWKGFYKEVV